MKKQEPNLSILQAKINELPKNTASIRLSEVYDEYHYLKPFNLYVAYYNNIPNVSEEKRINCSKAIQWLSEAFKNEIEDVFYKKRYFSYGKKAELDDVFVLLSHGLLIYFDSSNSKATFFFRNANPAKIDAIINGIKKFRTRKFTKPTINLLYQTTHGIEVKSMEINRQKLNIKENYNNDFEALHQTMINRLTRKNDKGLILLYGKPGTGKTSYIRYLISKVKKDIIFMPPKIAAVITGPELISVLMDNKNSILVIEDAENIVVGRERNTNSPVSALLNIADGLLSDCLNIQIICTFNSDTSKVDSALMRKGRLIANYEFRELEVEKAINLSRKLGFPGEIKRPMTLSEIYNQDERDFSNNNKRASTIGFSLSNN